MADCQDLSTLLQKLNDVEHLKDVRFLRICIYEVLTLLHNGCDVTPALPTVVKLLAYSDTFVKRVAGEIIGILAEQNHEMVLLATNTLVQDCKDVNPVIRGLGLKVLGSLQSPLATEMLHTAVIQGLEDTSPNVRRCSALASARLHHIAPSIVMEGGIWDSLYGHLSDQDSATVASCLCSLEEIFVGEKGIIVSNKLGLYLINNLLTFTPCVQRFVLQFLLKHSPKTKSQVFEHLNSLDESLSKNSSMATTLCALEVFCHLTSNIPKVKQKAYATGWNTIKMNLARERNEEMVAAVIDYLVRTNFPVNIIDQDFNKFFCRDDDAQFLMRQKIKILCKLITTDNAENILDEFLSSARRLDIDAVKDMVWNLIDAVSTRSEVEISCVHFLKRLIQLGIVGVTECVIQVLAPVSFSDDNYWALLAPCIQDNYQEIKSAVGKVALLDIISFHSQHFSSAPEILEQMMNELEDDVADSLEQQLVHQSENLSLHQNHQMKLGLLGAMVRVCLHQPAKIQMMLSKLMEMCIRDQNRNVRDRALFLYGFLESKSHIKVS